VTVEPPSWGKLTKSLAIKCINSICSRLHRIFFIFYDGLFLLSELIGILKVEPLIARTMQVGILLMRLINFGFLHYRHGCSCSGCPIPPFFCILFLLVSSAECLVSDGVFYDAFRSRMLIFRPFAITNPTPHNARCKQLKGTEPSPGFTTRIGNMHRHLGVKAATSMAGNESNARHFMTLAPGTLLGI